jgi:hypothetical protein
VRVHLAAKHALELEAAHLLFEALRVRLDIACGRLVVFGLGQLQQFAGITDALGGALDGADVGAQARAFAAELLGALRLGPDLRIFQLARYFLEPLVFAIVLKETPVTRPYARPGL